MAKKIKIEEGLERLEDILAKMGNTDTDLSDSFKLYEEGMKLLKSVNDEIDAVEKKVMVLSGDGKLDEFEAIDEE